MEKKSREKSLKQGKKSTKSKKSNAAQILGQTTGVNINSQIQKSQIRPSCPIDFKETKTIDDYETEEDLNKHVTKKEILKVKEEKKSVQKKEILKSQQSRNTQQINPSIKKGNNSVSKNELGGKGKDDEVGNNDQKKQSQVDVISEIQIPDTNEGSKKRNLSKSKLKNQGQSPLKQLKKDTDINEKNQEIKVQSSKKLKSAKRQ